AIQPANAPLDRIARFYSVTTLEIADEPEPERILPIEEVELPRRILRVAEAFSLNRKNVLLHRPEARRDVLRIASRKSERCFDSVDVAMHRRADVADVAKLPNNGNDVHRAIRATLGESARGFRRKLRDAAEQRMNLVARPVDGAFGMKQNGSAGDRPL